MKNKTGSRGGHGGIRSRCLSRDLAPSNYNGKSTLASAVQEPEKACSVCARLASPPTRTNTSTHHRKPLPSWLRREQTWGWAWERASVCGRERERPRRCCLSQHSRRHPTQSRTLTSLSHLGSQSAYRQCHTRHCRARTCATRRPPRSARAGAWCAWKASGHRPHCELVQRGPRRLAVAGV